jgi:hypothetical protein
VGSKVEKGTAVETISTDFDRQAVAATPVFGQVYDLSGGVFPSGNGGGGE